MKLLFLCGVSALAFASYNATHNVSHDRVAPVSQHVIEENVAVVPQKDKTIVHNTTQKVPLQPSKRSLIHRSRHNATRDVVHNETKLTPTEKVTVTEVNTTKGRKLLQAQPATQTQAQPATMDQKLSLLKDYRTDIPRNSSVYNLTDRFWQEVKKWALDANQLECRDLMQKWFDKNSVFQTSGLPTSFSMIGNNGAVCKILKQILTAKSLMWETAFFNDLMSTVMGSIWVSGQAVDRTVQLPDQMELMYHIQFDPSTNKLVELEIVPVDPDVIYEAVATKPVKSFHHIIRTGMQEGLTSPKFLDLLSDKFVLEVPNLFLGDTESKTRFRKSDLQDFVDQDLSVFDLENAKISSFLIPFHDAKSVVSEISFDELPIKANGIMLQGVKFWMIHTFDCNATNASATTINTTINTTSTRKTRATSDQADVRGDKDENYCVLEKLIVTVNRPISLLTRLVPFEIQQQDNSSKTAESPRKKDESSK